jgi:anti-sigma regulatory factor (Ser/Thr protein kinase)
MLHGMHVAIEEAVANVALRAFGPDQPGDIAVRLRAAPGAAALVVEDGGRPFDPAAAPARPARLQDARPNGLGLSLLRHYCRDISYERIGGRNRLTPRFPQPGR